MLFEMATGVSDSNRPTRTSPIARANVVSAARSYIGTPFVHQGRLRGVGVDCVGLLIGMARDLGIADVSYTGYRRTGDGMLLMQALESHLVRLPDDAFFAAGQVLAIRYRNPQHVAVVTDVAPDSVTIVHAIERGVTEHILDARWRRRIYAIFDFPGVIDG